MHEKLKAFINSLTEEEASELWDQIDDYTYLFLEEVEKLIAEEHPSLADWGDDLKGVDGHND